MVKIFLFLCRSTSIAFHWVSQQVSTDYIIHICRPNCLQNINVLFILDPSRPRPSYVLFFEIQFIKILWDDIRGQK